MAVERSRFLLLQHNFTDLIDPCMTIRETHNIGRHLRSSNPVLPLNARGSKAHRSFVTSTYTHIYKHTHTCIHTRNVGALTQASWHLVQDPYIEHGHTCLPQCSVKTTVLEGVLVKALNFPEQHWISGAAPSYWNFAGNWLLFYWPNLESYCSLPWSGYQRAGVNMFPKAAWHYWKL